MSGDGFEWRWDWRSSDRPDPELGRRAAAALEAMEPEAAVQAITGGMFTGRCQDEALQELGSRLLEGMEPEAVAKFRRLADSLWVIEVLAGSFSDFLASAGIDARRVIDAHISYLRGDEDPGVESFLEDLPFRVLSGLGERARGIVPVLVRYLRNPAPSARFLGARALAALGEHALAAVPALAEGLSDSQGPVRTWCCAALARIGPLAHAAVPALERLLTSPVAVDRLAAARALGDVGVPAASIPALAARLDDEETDVRVAAAWALSSLGPEVEPAVPALLTALDDPAPQVRSWACIGIEAAGAAGAAAIPRLCDLLAGGDVDERAAAAKALGGVLPEARPAPRLIARVTELLGRRLADEEADVRAAEIGRAHV